MAKFPVMVGKIFYGAVFVAGVPVLLIFWARATEASVALPPIRSLPAGVAIGGIGAAIMLAGMAAIWVYGHGLPMNAYPPARYVSEGVYRLFAHPIYTGFSILSFGIAIAAGSASGLWLVSPAVVLGCIALVEGYEKQATIELFGERDVRHLIRLPADDDTPPEVTDRISAYLLGVGPWLMFILISNPEPPSTLLSFKPFATLIALFPPAGVSYASRFLLILLVPILARTSRGVRAFVIYGLAALGISALLFVAYPYVEDRLTFEPGTIIGDLMLWDQTNPSIFSFASQIAWTGIAAMIFARTAGFLRWVAMIWAALIIVSGLVIGAQTALSLVAGTLVFFFAIRIRWFWEMARRGTQRIANGWTEWRFGPVRLINHGFFAAVGAFVALTIVGTLVGRAYVPHVIMITFLGIAVSSLSAQWIEGSPMLLRPYGWYGGVAGVVLGVLIVWAIGGDVWLIAAAFCVGAPWIQSAGRLRCLVQGCCHGRATTPGIGIRVVHHMSRVCRLSNLTGVAVHPTQLYSIICNVVIGVFVSRLWLSGASLAMIVGIYLILSGLGRFVEESLRGEPQTPKFGGLRLYQILAILTVAGGIGVTMFHGSGGAPELRFNWFAVVASGCFSIFVLFAFGVDLPDSNRRFARLA